MLARDQVLGPPTRAQGLEQAKFHTRFGSKGETKCRGEDAMRAAHGTMDIPDIPSYEELASYGGLPMRYFSEECMPFSQDFMPTYISQSSGARSDGLDTAEIVPAKKSTMIPAPVEKGRAQAPRRPMGDAMTCPNLESILDYPVLESSSECDSPDSSADESGCKRTPCDEDAVDKKPKSRTPRTTSAMTKPSMDEPQKSTSSAERLRRRSVQVKKRVDKLASLTGSHSIEIYGQFPESMWDIVSDDSNGE
jgi:hypothetical protein